MSDNVLRGKTIAAIWTASDKEAIRFDLADGESVVANCYGDCCSHTWIEDVIEPDAAIGAEVLSADDIELPEHMQQPTKTENYEEEMSYYGFAITTSKGRCTIAYRNSSNGYYGGSLAWPGEYYYGGVSGQNNTAGEWVLLAGEPKADGQ
jgi:hypothetical protein